MEYRRLSGKRGPGAGRPAKLYKRSSQEIKVSLPHREYELVARLFAQALDENSDGASSLRPVARSFGRKMGEETKKRAGRRQGTKNLARTAEEVLEDYGFEPFHDEDGSIRLRNCPFHALSQQLHRACVRDECRNHASDGGGARPRAFQGSTRASAWDVLCRFPTHLIPVAHERNGV